MRGGQTSNFELIYSTWSDYNEVLATPGAGDGTVNKAVKTVCLHEASICRIRKEMAVKTCSLRNAKRSLGVVKRDLVKRLSWEGLMLCMLIRRDQVMF